MKICYLGKKGLQQGNKEGIMKEIAKNAYYELAYDDTKNRIYWIMRTDTFL